MDSSGGPFTALVPEPGRALSSQREPPRKCLSSDGHRIPTRFLQIHTPPHRKSKQCINNTNHLYCSRKNPLKQNQLKKKPISECQGGTQRGGLGSLAPAALGAGHFTATAFLPPGQTATQQKKQSNIFTFSQRGSDLGGLRGFAQHTSAPLHRTYGSPITPPPTRHSGRELSLICG